MNEWIPAVGLAFWFGLLTAISPCPLATNIAAISFTSRKVGSIPHILGAGLCYTAGRTLTYVLLGFLLVRGLLAAPEISHLLQKYMNLLMGPLLILVAMILLNLLSLPVPSSGGIVERFQTRIGKTGVPGAGLLGILFALSFCPTSAALFFGSLLPLAVKMESGFLLPAVYGVATGLPVLVSAFLLAFGANKVAQAYDRVAVFEKRARQITGILFLAIGIWMTFTITLGVRL